MLAPAAGARPATNRVATALVIRGHGFGHGIGLSQWGAEKRAEAGQSYRQILSFYYPGTTLGRAAPHTVRVLVAEGARLPIGSSAPFTVRDAHGRVVRFAAGRYVAGADGRLGAAHLAFPVAVRARAGKVRVGSADYHGTLTLWRGAGATVRAVNSVQLEDYVRDVVSAECPGYWRQDALRAQAIAARTYALANLHPGRTFDLYPDDRSQNYRGADKEFASARMAAGATAGKVVLYRGRLIDAMFSASNGGLTSAGAPAWGGAVPYLVTRPDPFDARSPDLNWGPVRIPVAALHAAFPQLPASVSGVRVVADASSRVESLIFTGAQGASARINGTLFQQRLGLRSTFLTVTPVV